MVIGLALVHLQTSHRQTVYRMTVSREHEQRMLQSIKLQHELIAVQMESPQRIEERISHLRLELYRPGDRPEAGPVVAVKREGKTALRAN